MKKKIIIGMKFIHKTLISYNLVLVIMVMFGVLKMMVLFTLEQESQQIITLVMIG